MKLYLTILFFAAAYGAPLISDGHKGLTSESDGGEVVEEATLDGVIINAFTAKPNNGDGAKDSKQGVKETAKPAPVLSLPTLFVIADGPSAFPGQDEPTHWKLSDDLHKTIKNKIPGATVLTVRPLTLEKLVGAYNNSVSGKSFDSVLLIVNAEARVSPTEELEVLTAEGFATEKAFRQSVYRLGRSISGGPPKDATQGKAKIDTILLTSYSGRIQCPQFPGPVFGMSSSKNVRDLNTLTTFLNRERENPNTLFPTTARSWYDGWRPSAKRFDENGVAYTVGHFFCSYQNQRGYLGIKTEEAD